MWHCIYNRNSTEYLTSDSKLRYKYLRWDKFRVTTINTDLRDVSRFWLENSQVNCNTYVSTDTCTPISSLERHGDTINKEQRLMLQRWISRGRGKTKLYIPRTCVFLHAYFFIFACAPASFRCRSFTSRFTSRSRSQYAALARALFIYSLYAILAMPSVNTETSEPATFRVSTASRA